MKRSLQLMAVVLVLAFSVAGCRRQVDYTSKDVGLALAVRDQFDASPDTKGATSHVRVEAKDGAVMLRGTTDTASDRSLAEVIARRTSGVTSVVNEITVTGKVAPPGQPLDEQAVRNRAAVSGEIIGPSSEDARIYSELRRQIVADEATPKKSIFIDVQNRNVTLRGMVFTTDAKRDAIQAAKKVKGVNAVNDRLVVNTLIP